MPYRHSFKAPEYYKDFACKCGDCRSTCCHGWGIALSQDEYFRVMGTDCSPELRRRLDVAFRPASNPAPTPERYAMISYNWLGKCPIQNDEGLCMLHRECGEGAIPEICRRYPRCVRVAPTHECCTSTSCEYTLELLWRDDAPVKFETMEFFMYNEDFDAPAAASLDVEYYEECREKAFAIISERGKGIDARIKALAEEFGAELPYYIMPGKECAQLFDIFKKNSNALSELADAVDSHMPRFDLDSIPKMDIYIEKMLVNHIFYKAFPRSFDNSTLTDEIFALVAVRGLHRYVCEAYLGVHGYTFENFVDVTAQLFRMIEHSRFDEAAAKFMRMN